MLQRELFQAKMYTFEIHIDMKAYLMKPEYSLYLFDFRMLNMKGYLIPISTENQWYHY